MMTNYGTPSRTFVSGKGCVLKDDQGKSYLDFLAGIATNVLGHGHPAVIKAVTKQVSTLAHVSNFFAHPQGLLLASRLQKMTGDSNARIFFCNSGAEANENALKLASFHNGRKKIIAFNKAFHGRTSLAVSATDNKNYIAPVNETDNVIFLPFNDEAALEACFKKQGDEISSVIIEGIQGVGGINVATESFLQKIRSLCDQYGAVYIADSVQCGYGRTGQFFAHDHAGVNADIYSMAKGMGNGFPIGGILIAPHIAPKYGANQQFAKYDTLPAVGKEAQKHIQKVKTGLPGVAYLRLDDSQPWPEQCNTLKPVSSHAVRAHVVQADALREKLGHYLGGMLYYEGEWYWGVDRLYHLEQRLQELGAQRSGAIGLLFPADDGLKQIKPINNPPAIDFFFSLRSPYSAIVASRIFELGRLTGAKINLRFVLPMVMRGLPVPKVKREYIVHDSAREAHVRGVPFGRLNDPVGKPTERGLALIPFAEQHSKGQDFVLAFMHCVWAEGIDAGSDKGLRKIVEQAGLSWEGAQVALQHEAWRERAAANREELFAAGLWGVPSFKVGKTAVWGQDRLWAVHAALKTNA